MPDTPTILLSKKARGRVHPTRALPPKKRPTRWALSLAEAARDVVASLGAGPAAYAEKHAPAALPAMREVSAALWPDGEGAKTPAFAPARLEALLYRCFHIDVDAELFVQTWLDRGGVSLAVDVLFELDSFDAVLCWQRSSSSYAEGRSPLAAITLERREVDGAYQHLAARNEHYTAPAGTLHHAPARHLRIALALADDADYQRARERAEQHAARAASPIAGALAAYLFADAGWGAAAAEALLAHRIEPDAGEQALAIAVDERRHWLRWLLATPLPLALAERVLDDIDDALECMVNRGHTPLHTLLALHELEHGADASALEALLLERVRPELSGRKWARVKNLAPALVEIRSGAVADVLAENLKHRGLKQAASEYSKRFPELMLPRLRAVTGRHKNAALELAGALAQQFPDLDQSDAAAAAPSREAASGETAAPSQLPRVLREPPWTRKVPRAKAFERALQMLDVPARLQLLPGEAEAWQALASVRVNQLASAPEHTAQQVNERALEFPYGLRPLEHRRYLVARFGSAVIPALVSYVRPFTSHDARYLEPLTRIDSPLAAAAMVPHAFLDERLWRFEAQSALLAFPRAAAVALIPATLSGDADAARALWLLLAAGHADVVDAVAGEYGDDAQAAIRARYPSGEHWRPPRKPALPKWIDPRGLPALSLRAPDAAQLPSDAMAVVVQLLCSSETCALHPGLRDVAARCEPNSVDRLCAALLGAWRHSASNRAGWSRHLWAACASGWLGSEAAVETLARHIDDWQKQRLAALAALALEGLVAGIATRDSGAALAHLVRLSRDTRSDEVREQAARWLDVLATRLGGADPDEHVLRDSLDDAPWRAFFERALRGQRRYDADFFARVIADHPRGRSLAATLVWGAYDQDGALAATFRPGESGHVGPAGAATQLPSGARVGLVHPLELDEPLLAAWREQLAGVTQCVAQLERPAWRGAADALPHPRGETIAYRRLERMMVERGWRLYRTHCGAPLHDWSYLQRSFDDGRYRVSLGFNFGEHLGDSVIGELIVQRDARDAAIRPAERSLSPLSAAALSELAVELALLHAQR